MSQILLVEGKDDQHVIWALCQKFNVPQNFEVQDAKGIDNLFKQLPVRLKQSGIKTIGIIIDADTDIESRWAKVRSILIEGMPDFPQKPALEGTIYKQANVKIGVWLMPNNQLDGMLESFIEFLIPSNDKLLPIVNNHLNDIENEGLNKYNTIHRDKALIHSYLAIQEDPGTPMGLSITKKYLTTDVEQCQSLIDWLMNLFN